jgi:hypothetical protein
MGQFIFLVNILKAKELNMFSFTTNTLTRTSAALASSTIGSKTSAFLKFKLFSLLAR